MNALSFKGYGVSGAACLCLLIGSAARAQVVNLHGRVIEVNTVKELYAVVNNPANRGVTVHLAPGTYLLSTTTGGDVVRRNRGALRLPPGMSLVGSEKRVDTNGDGVPDPVSAATPDDFAVPGTETIIDGSALDLPVLQRTDCAGEIFFAPNPVIHVGVNNLISHLTVSAGNHVSIGEPTNDPVDPNGNLSMEVTYSVLEGIMTFANCECAARRARSVLTFSHNVVRGAAGVLIQNFLTGDASNDHSDGPAIWSTLTSNLFYNIGGLSATGGDKGTDGGSVTLYMSGNVFRNNGNFLGLGGVSREGFPPAIGNRLSVRSESDTFGEANAGVHLEAGRGVLDDPRGSEIEAEFIRSHFIRESPDTPPEITIIGGPGIRNHVKVLIRRATVRTSDGVRSEGGLLIQDETDPGTGANTARLEGSRKDFIRFNQGLPAPDAQFFLEH